MKRKTLSIVVFLLAFVLFGLLFVNHRQEQRQVAHMQQPQKEARSYQLEIDEIRSDLAQRELAVKTTEDTSRQERQEAYEKYEAEQKKSIQELEEKISAIYSRWDEY